MKRILLVVSAVLVCAGCSTVSDFCTGTAAGQAALGGFNPLAIPCIAHDVVYVGGRMVNLSGGSSDENSEYKTFRSSKAVYDDMSNNGELMQFVLDSQDRYKSADYGDATSEQKKHTVGRYVSSKVGKAIVIIDAQKAFLVMFENEYVPVPATETPATAPVKNS